MPFHLSPELLAIIISFLPLLSTVSQTWQVAIERLTMSAIHLKSTDLATVLPLRSYTMTPSSHPTVTVDVRDLRGTAIRRSTTKP